MRIWDIHPGYLARQQLLGEHAELHGLYNILTEKKQGYARHPETLRWAGHPVALRQRHELLAGEMRLRGCHHHSPLPGLAQEVIWPAGYIDAPGRQLELLAGKYVADGRGGRIPLPRNAQELWAQHKYSVMAHSPDLYAELGSKLAGGGYQDDLPGLALLLVEVLRRPVSPGRLRNALQHMWGYLNSGHPSMPEEPVLLLAEIQRQAMAQQESYLLHSTALSELAVWL